MIGTTLVELLVVIVVLLIGILAVLQIFPSGLRILSLDRSALIATKLANDEAERLNGRSEQMPEQIIPVKFLWSATKMAALAYTDETRNPNDFSLNVDGSIVDSTGRVQDGSGNPLGTWAYLSGPNMFRRVVGEGGRVPAPRKVGDMFGGLMVLQFTPIVYNSAFPGLFAVYGADMVRKEGPPQVGDTPQAFEYYIENPDLASAALIIPADAFAQRTYRLAASCYVNNGGTIRKEDVVDVQVDVPATGTGSPGFYTIPLSTATGFGASLVSAEFESIRLARQYDKIDNLDPFTDPYQYKLLDADLGLILFSDQAAKAYEVRLGKREPLQARVNYDVYDWRVMRDEFRVPDGTIPQVKLQLGNLKVVGMRDVDDTKYVGLSLNLQTGTGTTERRDLALLDLDSGGIILTKSATRMSAGAPLELVHINRSVGLLTFADADGNPNNGITGEIVYPGTSTPTDINLTGRAIRAMYQARNEWAVQVLKAPSIFVQAAIVPGATKPGNAEYYVGNTDVGTGGSPTRIYFSQSESGHRITLDQIWYRTMTNPNAVSMQDQSFVVQSQPADPLGLPYIDIKTIDPDAQAFDLTTYGYAAKGVRGASVTVRVLWNPSTLSFTDDPAVNLNHLEIWGREWRKTSVETYVKRTGS